ncbi:hypothetical protein [Agrococcus jenensis]|uniref:SpaA-like prealbumin fold domain-containing protein n=1 Tax=Agrococcus jenensis TaxID=46353 RepID=A0A3N2AQH9_9MICO|nr:hypothetical protein [Agrococcus jenensis]ROR65287.1 hypothetical protein EDD26_0653 [Agrococcus jenensis]
MPWSMSRRVRARAVATGVALVLAIGALVGPVVPAPSAAAVTGPEPTVAAPYLHWRATDSATGALVGGATFELQGPRSATGMTWNTAITVADCSAAPCTGADLDPDAGELQVTNIGNHRITAADRYRLRQTASPSGYVAPTTAASTFVEMPAGATWTAGAYSFGTYALTARAALACATGTFYSVSSAGLVRRVNNVSGTGTITDFGTFPGTLANVNALGIGSGGTTMYAVERSTSAADVLSVLRYTVASGWETVAGSAYTTGNSSSLVAGAVSRTNGRYYFGGPHQAAGSSTFSFRLHQFDPATGQRSLVGTIATSSTVAANGDMLFDSAGNLILILSGTSGVTTHTVAAATLAAATGGALAATSTTVASSVGADINGFAYESDGSVYAGNGTTVRRYDPTTWTQIGTTPVTTALTSSTDLASCAAPVSITVVKTVTGRVAATDQFTLAVRNASSTVLGTATTTGTSLGQQAARITGVNVPTGAALTIAETAASGSLTNYQSTWACTSNGAAYTSGTGASIALTTPAAPGASVVCTFTNAPLITSVVVRKVVQDSAGANPQPGVGWTVRAATTAQTGTVTAAPTASTQQTLADGAARWSLRHSATSALATIAVGETQQAGFDFASGQCTVTTAAGAVSTVALLSASGASVTGVQPGSSVDCTIVNRVRATTLTLVKAVSFGDAAPGSWPLAAVGPSGSLAGPSGTSGAASASGRITPGVAYRLSESGGPATYVQVGGWACVNQAGAAVTVSAAGEVTATQGDAVTCTVTNATAQLVVLEHIEGTATVQPSQFSLTATPAARPGLSASTVPGSDVVGTAATVQVRPGHSYALASTSEAPHLQLRFERYVGTVGEGGAVDHADASLWRAADPSTVAVAAGQTAIYRFVAAEPLAFALPYTGGVGLDQVQLLGAGVSAVGLLAGLTALLLRRRRTP